MTWSLRHPIVRSAAAVLYWTLCTASGDDGGTSDGGVTFDAYAPQSRPDVVLRRTLSPLAHTLVGQRLVRSGRRLAEQDIDLARERFDLRVPGRAPERGYGLFVFVSPERSAAPPPGWADQLSRRGIIYVAAANSGNDTDVLGRRVPLALLAWHNVATRFALDPTRVYVGGLSGGSRVAMRIALTYPDVFGGALLDAGSDPPGTEQQPLPARELLERAQRRSRFVLMTGSADEAIAERDRISAAALRAVCISNVAVRIVPALAHAPAPAAALGRAIDALEKPAADAPGLDRCRGALDTRIARRVDEARAALDRGSTSQAAAMIRAIDRQYGGLADPPIIMLARRAGLLDDRP